MSDSETSDCEIVFVVASFSFPTSPRSSCGPKVTMALMKKRFAKSQEKAMVKQRKVPNCAKKTSLHPKRGREAPTDVIIPLWGCRRVREGSRKTEGGIEGWRSRGMTILNQMLWAGASKTRWNSERLTCDQTCRQPEHRRPHLRECIDEALLARAGRVGVGVRKMHNVIDAEACKNRDEDRLDGAAFPPTPISRPIRSCAVCSRNAKMQERNGFGKSLTPSSW